jgi:hypothetical protein
MSFRLIDYNNPINRYSSLNRGLVGWWLTSPWTFGQGKWLDLCKRNHGVLNGSTWNPFTRLGGFGSMFFDGAASYVAVSDSATFDFGANDFAVSAYARPDSLNTKVVVSQWDGATGWLFYFFSDGKLYLETWNSTAFTFVGSTSTFSINRWYHILIQRVGDVLQLFSDGIQIGESSGVIRDVSNAQDLYIGKYLSGGQFAGFIDDVRIYNRSFSLKEAQQLYLTSNLTYLQELNRIKRKIYFLPLIIPPLTINTKAIQILKFENKSLFDSFLKAEQME